MIVQKFLVKLGFQNNPDRSVDMSDAWLRFKDKFATNDLKMQIFNILKCFNC